MKTAILHLSDLHISSVDDFVVSNCDLIANAIRYYTNECNRCIIVITGDIIDKGNVSCYEIAKNFLLSLKTNLLKERIISIDFVIVPGNHDIDFSTPQKIREMAINNLNKQDSLEPDNDELVNVALDPQSKFWSFLQDFMVLESNERISYTRRFGLGNGGTLSFHCYNTAFLSTINEQPGSLVIHENYFIKEGNRSSNDIIITVLHHSPSWLSTRTPKNNQKQFQKHILGESNIIMCGHEHMSNSLSMSSSFKASPVIYLEADSFKYGNERDFDLLILNTEGPELLIERKTFQIGEDNNGCRIIIEDQLSIQTEKIGLSFSDKHSEYLSKLSLPIKHPRIERLTLQDVYVYPDIMPLSKDRANTLYIHEDSIGFIENAEEGKVYIFEGENQAGKTAFLKQISIDGYSHGDFPLWINGAEISHPNISQLLKKAFNAQYEKTYKFEDYTSIPKSQRIILIDNIDKSSLNRESLDQMIEMILRNYKFVVLTTKPNPDILSIIRQSDINSPYSYYQILSFGHIKRNELIERWFQLGVDYHQRNDAELVDKIKLVYNQISSILSGDLLPAYPVFLLTILHSMSSLVDSYDLAPTSYANLYHTLLLTSLGRAEVPQDKLNGVITFLTELAYDMYKHKEREIGVFPNVCVINFDSFYVSYAKLRIPPYGDGKLSDLLIQAGILSPTENGNLCFSYKYLYYYLVGRKLAGLVDSGSGASDLTYLCNHINEEESANILVFLAYLIKNPISLLDEIRLTTQIPLNEVNPITLSINDPLFVQLSSLVKNIKEHILLADVDYKEARTKLLKANDDAELRAQVACHEDKQEEDQFEELDGQIKDINTILKSVRVIGQIVKNQSGTLTIPELEALVEDSYLSSFRLIGRFVQLVEQDFAAIVDEICNIHRIEKANRNQVEGHVATVLSGLLFKLCLSVFSNLALSVGTTDLQQIFDNVANKIGSPAAHIISFTINSYYGPFRIEYLKDMVNQYRNNPVVMNLIQARVRHYVYHHDLPYNKKQQFGEISGLKLINSKKSIS